MKKRNIVLLLILGLLLSICIFFSFFGRIYPSNVTLKQDTKTENALHMNPSLFLSQTYNNCGPYSAMAAINIVNGEVTEAEQLAKETKYRIIDNLTLPQGVVKLLKDHNVKVEQYILKNLTDDEKILFLKNQIDTGHPVILLIRIDGYLHYVTVLGYNERGFMLYESLMPPKEEGKRITTRDYNATEGNCYSLNTRIISLWNNGGVGPFFNNYAIVCSKNEE